jgi:hypothetical protein
MSELRLNRAKVPSTLVPRNEPRLTSEARKRAAIATSVLETAIERPAPQRPRIVSSAHGPFRRILMAYPSYADGDDVYHTVFVDLFRQLPATTELIVVAHPSVTGSLQDVLNSTRPGSKNMVVETPPHVYFSVWAEDPYVVVEDVGREPQTTFFVEPFAFTRYGDTLIADLVAQATDLQSTQAPLVFQGGNVLIGDTFVLLGIDYLLETWDAMAQPQPPIAPPHTGQTPHEFIHDLFRQTFDPARELLFVGSKQDMPRQETRPTEINGERWKEVIYAGTGYRQPIFHIDMFVSLAGREGDGRYRLLVGSPQVADQVLGRETVPHALAAAFDEMAAMLEAQGFAVTRNPLPITHIDDKENKLRRWYFATSNNSLVQIDGDSRDVWLPTYGYGDWQDLAATDEENKRVWRELGFTVHQLADFHVFAQNLGAVHCIKKYLAR